MIWEIISIIILLFLTVFQFVCQIKEKPKIIFFIRFGLTLTLEITFFILLILNYRLTNISYLLLFSVCFIIITVSAVLNKNKSLKTTTAIALVSCGIIIAAQFLFVSQNTIVIDGVAYVGEYDNSTGITSTLVTCYKKKNDYLMENKISLLLDYGVVLTDKPDFSNDPYSIIVVEE